MSVAKVVASLTLALLTLTCTALASAGPPGPSAACAGDPDPRPAPDLGLRHPSAADSEAAVKQLKERELYDSLAAAVEATRYRVSPRLAAAAEPAGYEGANPAQRFRASFDTHGVELRPTGEPGGWRLGLSLRAWGYGERLEPPGVALIEASGNRVEYRYPAGGIEAVTEWYVNTALGIEQGFTLARPPAGARGTGPLTLAVGVIGDLAPRLAQGGQAVQLVSADGTAVLGYAGLRAWDASGRTLASQLAVEAGQMRLRVDDAAATYPVTVDPIVYSETKLAASDGATGDNFGASPAISGDTVVIGAPSHDTGGKSAAGQVYVYVRNGTVWTEQAKLVASDGAEFDTFGSSVRISGDTVVVGAYYHATGGKAKAGQAYVYVRSGTVWSEQAKLTASDGAAGDMFGFSVAIHGDTVVVGAPGHATGGTYFAGQAYVYVRSGTVWSEQAKLAASNGAANDMFGFSTAIEGDTAVVGAPSYPYASPYGPGQAYAYVRSGTAWSEQATLAASDGVAGDAFGSSVAISVDTAVVGAHSHPYPSELGQAYVYTRSGTTWSEQARLAASDGAGGDHFGSVAISGDTAVVGAFNHATGRRKHGAGQAYVYARSGTAWSEQAKLLASDGAAFDGFGGSAISGDTIVVGAPQHAAGGIAGAGQAYVYVPAGSDLVTILKAVFVRPLGILSVSATSSAAPDAALSLTVPGCVSDTPMFFRGGTYSFSTRACGNLDGVTATVQSDRGGSATGVIK